MPTGDWKTLTVRTELKEGLQRTFENDQKRFQRQSFSSWFENRIQNIIDYEEAVHEYGYIFEFETVSDNQIIIKDNFIGKHVFVYFQDKTLYLPV